MRYFNKKKIKGFIKLSFFLIALLFSISSCKKKGCTDPVSLAYDNKATKDDGTCTYPENDRRILIYYSTGTWCQHCGDIGKTFVDDISSNYPEAQIIRLHKNDELTSNMGTLIQSYLDSVNGVMGCPNFYVGTNSVVNPNINPNNFNLLSSAVYADLLLSSEVNMDIEYSINGNKITIEVQSKLATGIVNENYYLSTYILEDGIVLSQNIAGNYDPNFVHNNILRMEVTEDVNVFGSKLNFDQNGNNKTSYYEVPLDSTAGWNYSNLHVVSVVWKDEGSSFKFVNLEN